MFVNSKIKYEILPDVSFKASLSCCFWQAAKCFRALSPIKLFTFESFHSGRTVQIWTTHSPTLRWKYWRTKAVLKASCDLSDFKVMFFLVFLFLSTHCMFSNNCSLWLFHVHSSSHVCFAFLPTGAQQLPAHLWSLIGRLILLSVSKATCRKHQTDCWWNATELQNTK